jgi:hypothetical protein
LEAKRKRLKRVKGQNPPYSPFYKGGNRGIMKMGN